GIILAKKNLKISIIEIVYLAVSDWNKTTGVEEMLIYALEDKAQKEKVNFINFDYFDNNDLDYLKYIDGILRKNNWSSLRKKLYLYNSEFQSRRTLLVQKIYKKYSKSVNISMGVTIRRRPSKAKRGRGKWIS
ncbi:hypothetical protein D7X33_41925, partial [Butyricicoccus sp. 1XD8-22]